jgi:hypothetical protein
MTTVSDYLEELVSFGGQTMTRAAVIAELQRLGLTPKEVDCYMQALDLGRKARGES